MTNTHLLGIAKVRRSLAVPIVVFTLLNALTTIRRHDAPWAVLAYVLFDIAIWISVSFFIFAVIERRQKMPRQPRIAAMAMATAGITTLAVTILALRSLYGALVRQLPFVPLFLRYFPGPFYLVVFYIAIVAGIGYAVHSRAVDERRLAEEAELDAAIARAELKAAAGRLQPELLDGALARLATLMETNPAAAQQLISDLGAMLHDTLGNRFLGVPRSSSAFLGGEGDHAEERRGTRGTPRNELTLP